MKNFSFTVAQQTKIAKKLAAFGFTDIEVSGDSVSLSHSDDYRMQYRFYAQKQGFSYSYVAYLTTEKGVDIITANSHPCYDLSEKTSFFDDAHINAEIIGSYEFACSKHE